MVQGKGGWVVDRVEIEFEVEQGRVDSKKGKTQQDDADTLEPRKPIPTFPRTRATDALQPSAFSLPRYLYVGIT